MTDDLDTQLRASLREEELPAAPDSIARFIAQLPATEAPVTRDRGLRSVLVVVVAVALIAAAAFGISGLDRAIGGPGPTASPTPSSGSGDVTPTRTVSEVLAARSAGTLRGETVTIRGFWSIRLMGHTCTTYPGQQHGVLEQIGCHEGEYGITELDELIVTAASPQPTPPPSPLQNLGPYLVGPRGPYLTPFVPTDLQDRLLTPELELGTRPVPIVVSGHFDDPRSFECDPLARQACRDRFVIEKIISFDPPEAPHPSPSPTRPVDGSIQPVSRSKPSADARAALQACGAFGERPEQIARLNSISGMGLIAHARDAARYVSLWGVEPEIQSDSPDWIIAMAGRIQLGSGYWADDPICVVVNGSATTFGVGAGGLGTETFAAVLAPTSPTMALPSLAP